MLELAGDRLPARVARAYRRYRHGPGAFKVDLAVEGGVPWTAPEARLAGTVHATGSFAEIVAAEREVNRGRMPARPFVLVGSAVPGRPESLRAATCTPSTRTPMCPPATTATPTRPSSARSSASRRGCASGSSVARSARPPRSRSDNPNYVGGDIITGANTPRQLFFRPRFALDPYATGADGVFICSAATPPGAGAHGMNGFNAAHSVLRHL